MDWGYGSCVPKNHEMLDRVPSSESWLRWAKSDYESMESLSQYIVPEKKPIQESPMEISSHIMENDNSNNSDARPCYFLNEEYGTDHIDDMSPLLDGDLQDMESLNESFGFSPDFDYNSMSRTSNSLKTDDFLPSQIVKEEECSPIYTPYNFVEQKRSPLAEASSIQLPYQSASLDVDASAEESVLQELRGVITQMTQKVRISFRDALYRLAESSDQKHGITTMGHLKEEIGVDSNSMVDKMQRPESNAPNPYPAMSSRKA